MGKLRVGIAGYGTVGKRRKLCVDQNPHMKLIAVCDKNFVCNNLREKNINQHTNYKSLLNEKLDVLIVCLSNDLASDSVLETIKDIVA